MLFRSGDSCRDIFVYCDADRLCPDVPVPVLNVLDQTENPGMAKNVQRNIKSIFNNCDIITNTNWYEITKTRYVDERTNSLLLRVDEEKKVPEQSYDLMEEIVDNKYNGINYDAIIISDYCKGFLSEDHIWEISNHNKNVFLDTKKILGEWCTSCDFIKINHVEYNKTYHTIDKLHVFDIFEKLIITHSDKGCEYLSKMFPVEKVVCKDLSGAGDTFVSALACEYARSKSIEEAIKFAQECATIVVQKKGVCTI